MDRSSRSSTKELEEFAVSRLGVEAFLEPKTNLYSTTLLLVADDGEYLRRPIKDGRQAGEFCKDVNIPLYDAKKVGYPKRMRDWDQGRAPERIELADLPPWPGDELPEEIDDPDRLDPDRSDRDHRDPEPGPDDEDGPPPPPTQR
ncbi:MAG: hypothetical protein ACOC9I_00825 [Actinomycetota bacterium]